ncbi:otogelin [Leptodactylus fuscus]
MVLLTCTGGKWLCTELTCPAECSVTGDFNIITFDGRKYTFQAPCQYILAKSLSSGTFTVSLQNAPCGALMDDASLTVVMFGVGRAATFCVSSGLDENLKAGDTSRHRANLDGSCIQSVNIIVHQDQRKQVILAQSGDIFVYDQYRINLPYTDDVFEIRQLPSMFVHVKTALGLQLFYHREELRLYLQVDGRWKDDTTGLCGTFNDNTQDDFLSPAGVPESTPQLFGNSWKTSSACGMEYLSSSLDPCDVHLQAASYATESCSIISREPFTPCHSYLSPVSYYEQCRRDTCKCGQACLCSALAHYAHQCRRFGIIINFRASVPSCDIPCHGLMVYSTCVSPCAQTCQSLSTPEACDAECIEGCACPENMYYNTELSRCVERNQCPCYYQGIDYHPGENIITTLGKCLCTDGLMKCESSETGPGCPIGQIYHNCSSPEVDPDLSQEKTCENLLLNVSASSSLPCVSGCVCPKGLSAEPVPIANSDARVCAEMGQPPPHTPEGVRSHIYSFLHRLVKHGSECLEPDACPCSWKAKEYFPGDIVHSSCHTCVCRHGAFQCSFHPCPSMCTFYADRHFRTFDGLTFDFVGACKVHLVKARAPNNFSVTAENVNCYSSGVICRKVISISVGRSSILFEDDTGNPSPLSVIDKSQEVHIWQAGFFTFVHFPLEYVTLLWDQRTTLHIQAGPQWQGALAGLCGNFDLKTINEMKTPDELELSNPQEFGASWTVAECLDSSDPRNLCHLNPLREPFAKKECGILLSEVFEACHPVVDVTWFYSNCLSDTCGCNRGGDCECFCTSVSAYAHQCCQQGVIVDWRSPRVCPYDCEFYNKVLGKGPYRLHSHVDRDLLLAVRMTDATVVPVKEERQVPGYSTDFMLTPGLFSPRAHDRNLVSLELAERPNFFLHLGGNGTLHVTKWQRSVEFQRRATFIIHKNRWTAGYNAFESLAKPGHFVRISSSFIYLTKYHHSAAFRLSTLFRLSDSTLREFPRSTCEWRYDACTSACYRTCRDPVGERCHSVPRVEGCFPLCPTDMVLDEVTKKCVYFPDCIEPAVNLTTLYYTTKLPRLTTMMNATTSSAVPVTVGSTVTEVVTSPISTTVSPEVYSAKSASTLHATMESTKSLKPETDGVRSSTEAGTLRTTVAITATSARTWTTSVPATQLSHVPIPSTAPAPGTIFTEATSSSISTVLPTTGEVPTTLPPLPNVTTTAFTSPDSRFQSSEAVTRSQLTSLTAKYMPSTSPTPSLTESYTSTTGSTEHMVSEPDLTTSIPTSPSMTTTTTHYTLVSQPLEGTTSVLQPATTSSTSKAVETTKLTMDTRPSTMQTFLTSTQLVTDETGRITTLGAKTSQAKYPTESTEGITQPSGVISENITKATTETSEVYTVLPLTTSLLVTRRNESMSGYPLSSSTTLGTTSTSSVTFPAHTVYFTETTLSTITLSTRSSTVKTVGTFTSKETPLTSETTLLTYKPVTERTRLAPTLSASSLPIHYRTTQATLGDLESRAVTKGPKLQRSEAVTVKSTPETASMTVTTIIASTTSAAEEYTTPEVSSHSTGTSQGTAQTSIEPKATTESTTFILKNITGTIKSTITTGRTVLPTDHSGYDTKLPPIYPTTDVSQPTSQSGITGTGLPSTMVPDLSVTQMSTTAKTDMTLSTRASDHSLFHTSRTTESTSPQTTYGKAPTSLSPAVSYSEPSVTTQASTEEKPLTETVTMTSIAPGLILSTSSTPLLSAHHTSISSITEFKPLTEKSETAFTSEASTTERRDLSPAEAYKTTGHVTTASQSLVVSETLATHRPSTEAWTSPGSTTEEKQTSAVTAAPGTATLSSTTYRPSIITDSLTASSGRLTSRVPITEETAVTVEMSTSVGTTPPSTSQEKPKYSTFAETSHTDLQPLSPTPSPGNVTYVPVTPVFVTHDIHVKVTDNQTATPSVTNQLQYKLPSSTDVTSPPLPVITSSRTFNETETSYPSLQSSTQGVSAGITVTSMLSSREAATSQTCTPYTENECIKHICVDGQLIQVNKSQHCPYNVTQPSCGLLGFAVQINGDRCCPKWECACRCSIFSDLSFVTFDGSYLALYKEASYIVTLTEDESITVQVSRCGQVSESDVTLCLSILELTYLSNQIIIDRLNRKVVVNSRNAWPMVRKYGYKIVDTGNMYLIDTPSDVKIQWFHSTGLMIIESNSTSKPTSMGLCGEYSTGYIQNTQCLESALIPHVYPGSFIAIHRHISLTSLGCEDIFFLLSLLRLLSSWPPPFLHLPAVRIFHHLSSHVLLPAPPLGQCKDKLWPSHMIYASHELREVIGRRYNVTLELSDDLVNMAATAGWYCDGNATNDLILPTGRVLSKSDDSEEFVDSWQVPYTLKYTGKERHRDLNCTVMDCSECFRLIVNQTFTSCHPYVSPESFCDLWVKDSEYAQDPCKAVTAYTAMCHKFNVCIEWRTSDFCPFSCPPSLIYRACLPVCDIPPTCQNNEIDLYDSESCTALTEGCVCAEGEVLHRPYSTVCISERKCACTDSTGTPREIGEVWSTSEEGCCTYQCADNDTIIPVQHNCSNTYEPLCQRHGEVLVSISNDQDCCPQKLCVCNETLCDGLVPECRNHEKLTAYHQDDSCCPRYTCDCDPEKCDQMDGPPQCREDQMLFATHTNDSCCVRYFCGCDACSEPVPTCQLGEMLTVSSNITERCCPTYQCVCDPTRCPDITCDLGMSAVEIWTPNSCCPYRTCECSCEKVQKPECKVGEKLEVDEEFVNPVANPCNCTLYKCVKDMVCVSKDYGVLRPGQTVVQHTSEGICHSSHCTSAIDPITKYHQINVSSLNCAAKCEANQLYEPPQDVTRCCGRCRNVSCVQTLLNGTVLTHVPGSTWISKCVRYDCTDTPVGPVLVTSAISCPPFNETECIKMGGYVVSFLDGCCKTCKEDGKFCKRVTVRMTIRKNDCRSNTPVNIVSCDGKCPSASIYNYNINTYARFCKCCRELGLQRRVVQLYCSGNSTWVNYSIQEPTDCSCQWS